MNVLYTAEALSTGAGRDGRVTTIDGRLDLEMAVPAEMGGSGQGANPELLFAAGYAACFHSAGVGENSGGREEPGLPSHASGQGDSRG